MDPVKYAAKRVLWLIPTLIVLIWLTGVLEDHMPGDPVAEILRQEEFEFRENAIERRRRYNEIAAQQNINLPGFYLTVQPRNFSRGTPLTDHRFDQNKKAWLRHKDVSAVNAYFDLITNELDQLSKSASSDNAGAFATLSYLGEIEPGSDIDWPNLRGAPQNTINEIRMAYQEMIKSRIGLANSLPVIAWNGPDNRLHQRLVNFTSGNWGVSIRDGRPVSQKVADALRWTVMISISALLLSLAIAFLLGWYASIHDRTWKEALLSQSLFVLYATPLFWLATMLIVFFTSDQYGDWMHIFPGVGVISMGHESFWTSLSGHWSMFILPILCLSSGSLAYFYQFILSGQRDESQKPYFITALSKGLTRSSALTRHTMINSLFPLLGLMALIIPGLISGALIIEVLFNIPGMGRLMFNSILAKDWNVVVVVVFLSGVVAFLAMTAVDIVLHYVDPKFRADG